MVGISAVFTSATTTVRKGHISDHEKALSMYIKSWNRAILKKVMRKKWKIFGFNFFSKTLY